MTWRSWLTMLIAALVSASCSILPEQHEPPGVGTELRDLARNPGDPPLQQAPVEWEEWLNAGVVETDERGQLKAVTADVAPGEQYVLFDRENFKRVTVANKALRETSNRLRNANQRLQLLWQEYQAVVSAGASKERIADMYRSLTINERRAAFFQDLVSTGLLGVAVLLLGAGAL